MRARILASLCFALLIAVVVWLASGQARLARQVRELKKQLTVLHDERLRGAGGGAPSTLGAAPRPGPGLQRAGGSGAGAVVRRPETTGSPEGEIGALRAQVETLTGELARMRPVVTERTDAADAARRAGYLEPVDAPELSSDWKLNSGRRWGEEQVLGEPNTLQHGDLPTAWAPEEPDGGEE